MKYSALTLGCILAFSSAAMAAENKTAEKSPEPRHGTSETPPSRQYYCYLQKDFNDGSDKIKNPACKAAFVAAGNADWERARLFNNWNAYSQNLSNGDVEKLVPDEKLCSAGIADYDSINLPHADWETTPLDVKDGRVTLDYKASQMHDPSKFRVFVSKPDFNPETSKLKWSDLLESPEVKSEGTPDSRGAIPGHYTLDVKLPEGYAADKKAIIYIMWERNDDPAHETFFSCSDVTLKNAS
ncbi:lytic polysaccharide monooxygenase auxiliary activity family 9 protein [Serratia odorifera]|uniref:lytic polysaccharide monooxygenase auxiliary activity family 9 protein n=1 Tax=Serratia odorifera TaxID=618 RepID=UPI0018E8010C|nr:lytic polysaccharide monooxygenase auxiliary activity family 9 protein [Serratia odorifera]MBJ2066890.1 lytic polysaccharide monooxygenase [Serratia odorifera]